MPRITHLHLMHRGLVPTDQLGSGTADSTTFLRGDQTWQPSTAITDITDIPTAETDTALRLAPDGTGGVEWAVTSGGGGGFTGVPEIPAGTIDGVNDDFTLSAAPTDGIILFKNGLYQREGSGDDYTITGSTITYEAGNIPQVGDSHVAFMLTAAGGSAITVEDEGTPLTTALTSLDFVGAGVTATNVGDAVTVTVSGGSGGTTDVYGDGQDGSVTINSGTFSVSTGGSALITNNALVRDAYFDDLTLNGGDLSLAGFRCFVAGTLTMTSGVIRNNGGAGGNGGAGTAGAGGAAGLGSGTTAAGTTAANAGGSGGRVGGFAANGIAGSVAAVNSNMGLGASAGGVAGGDSGQGETGGAGAASAAGNNTLTDRPAAYAQASSFRAQNGAGFNMIVVTGVPATSGSGAGAAASGGGGSGGTGGSGAPCVVFAKVITGTTDIQSLGGNGGNGGAGGGTNAGGGGGGQGGNGGYICLIYSDNSGWSGTLDVSGGTGGTGGALIGTGTAGANGNNGRAGKALSFQVNA